MKNNLIRNFAIIAHIDHGKSTLSDRMIEYCGGLQAREMQSQILDSMDIERERGITIKSQTVRLKYTSQDNSIYTLNLMDTPGHVDFAYEVSRCLAACEGSILLIDATQGVEAQTIANTYKALECGHEIIPVLNKTDLLSANVENCKKQIRDVIGITETDDIILASAKTGKGIAEILEAICKKIPHPQVQEAQNLKAMLIDSWYDPYLGVIMLLRVIDGQINKGDQIKMVTQNTIHIVEKIGVFTPKKEYVDQLSAGEIGFICANLRKISECRVGDTIVMKEDTTTCAIPGFKMIQPAVFCGIYPTENNAYPELKDALEKLCLNDSSILYEYESSAALGFGFRCGFLGLLHMEIVQERLEREFDVDLIATAPSVVYKIVLHNNTIMEIHNPAELPDQSLIKHIEEPIASINIVLPHSCVGDIITLCTNKRGIQQEMNFISEDRVVLIYHIPLAEIVFDFHDAIKSISRGYASFEWEFLRHAKADITKLDILINSEIVDALSMIIHKGIAERRGRALCVKLKELIPRHLFAVPIQAAIGGRIVARETISPIRKDVTAKCYGGDITRKRKLLDKQKRGKKKMKMLGNVELPQTAFLAVLKLDQ